jgi:isoleucyl-tRNA synthetase
VAVRGRTLTQAQIDVIKEELNVKALTLLKDASEIATINAKVNAKALGPRLGARVQSVIKLLKEGAFEVLSDGKIKVEELVLGPEEAQIGYAGKEGLPVESGSGFVIALDTRITPELELEGLARDLVRQIQELRKEANLNISDRIQLSVQGVESVLEKFSDYVKRETLTTELVGKLSNPLISKSVELEGSTAQISLSRA